MKMTNGKHTIETSDFLMNIWERDGYTIVEESEEMTYQELKSLAKQRGINTNGMKKEEIIQALSI